MEKKRKSNKPLGYFIKNSAERLEEGEKIYNMNGDPYFEKWLLTESWILLRLAVRYWFHIRYASIRCKLFLKKSDASNKSKNKASN
jgi:hypothetical protein